MPDHIPPLLQSLLKSTTEHFIEIFNKQPLACTFLVMCSIAYLNQKQLLKLMPQTITSDDAPNDQNMDMLSLPTVQIEPSQNQIHLNAHNQQTFFETLNAYHYFNFSSSLSTCMNRLRYYNNQASSFIGYVNSHINDFIEKTKQSTLAFCIPWVDVIASTETIPMTFNQTLLKYINVVINPYLEYNLLGFNHNVLNVYNDDQFFNKFNTLLSMLMFHKDTVIPYQTKLDIAKAIQADQFSSNAMKWHWLHLQNLILEMKRILVDDSEINIYRLINQKI